MAVYEDASPVVLRSITHSTEELAQFETITSQHGFRKQLVLDELERTSTSISTPSSAAAGSPSPWPAACMKSTAACSTT